jgi:AraC-like DNA-binding protein
MPSLHPIVTKLFVDVVQQLLPDLPPVELKSARLTFAEGHELLELAVQLTGRADLGVLAAQAAEPGHFDLVELASRAQSTVGEAIETLAPLLPMLHDGVELHLEHGAELSRVSLRLAKGVVLHPAGYDFALVSLLIAARRQTARADIAPTRVFLPYPAPPGPQPLARVIDVPLVHDAPGLAIEFPTAFLALPLVRADASMGRALREVAHDVLQRAASAARSKLESDVRERLRASLPRGDTSAPAIARQLHISERTLRRRLEAEGLSLRGLLDHVRHELALSMLASDETSTNEVAAALGFSTAQAFHRAFRRWTSLTVHAYRARLRSG